MHGSSRKRCGSKCGSMPNHTSYRNAPCTRFRAAKVYSSCKKHDVREAGGSDAEAKCGRKPFINTQAQEFGHTPMSVSVRCTLKKGAIPWVSAIRALPSFGHRVQMWCCNVRTSFITSHGVLVYVVPCYDLGTTPVSCSCV
jgi:hypothetical protein